MSKPIDRKFHFLATHAITGKTHSQNDGIVFLAKDDALPGTLLAYLEECQRLGAKTEQLEGVKRLIKRVEDWRIAHPDLCKVPDVEPGPEADRVLAD